MRRIVASLAAALVAAVVAPFFSAEPDGRTAAVAAEPRISPLFSEPLAVPLTDSATVGGSSPVETPADRRDGALVRLSAVLGGGPALMEGVSWTVTERATGAVVLESRDGRLDTVMRPGRYLATVTWTGWSDGLVKRGRLPLDLTAGSTTIRDVAIDLELSATLEAPDAVREGDLVPVVWSGPDTMGARLEIASPGAPAGDALTARTLAHEAPGRRETRVAWLQAPGTPGSYELRYVLDGSGAVLARRPLGVAAYDYALEAQAAAEPGARLAVSWRGPGHAGDVIVLARIGDPSTNEPLRSAAAASNPAEIALPDEPGHYELRYVAAAQRQIKAVRPIEVTPAPIETAALYGVD